MEADQRRETQARAVANQVMQGKRVESQSDYSAVMVRGNRVNHLLHFLIGFPTFGLWWIVWIVIALTGGEKRSIIQTDEFGNVRVEEV